MIPGANASGKPSEKIEAEDSFRTVECLRGRLLAERVASRNAKEEVEKMENKLIELEKGLKEESKSRNKAEKKLKFLLKKLESLNISFVSDEPEQLGLGLLEKSEVSSVLSSVASSSTEATEDNESTARVTNSAAVDIQDSMHISSSPPVPENLQQNVTSSAENHDNAATKETIGSRNVVNFPELSIQKEEIEEFKEKTESPTASNKSEQNASSSAENYDNPTAGEGICSSDGVNLPELTIQKEEIVEFKEKLESPTVLNKSEPDGSSSAKNLNKLAARETLASRNGVNFPELTVKKEETEEIEEKMDSPLSNKSEHKASLSSPINKCPPSPAYQENFTLVEAHSAKSNELESSQKVKKSSKDDHSLRALFKKEKLNDDNDQDQEEQVDNSLALVPVDLPKTKQTIDPAILDATVKEVLDVLRNAKEKLQTSMERRRSSMIKVG